MIERLQQHNFDFVNDGYKSYDELIKKYPNCKGAITWWTNNYPNKKGKKSIFNINNNFALKEFLINFPPQFKISAKCCDGAKKKVSYEYEKNNKFDLKCLGLRKAEGGIRSSAYKNCFEWNLDKETQSFRPIWYFDDKDKAEYIATEQIQLSDCYTIYGMKRTGCAGCPYNSRFEDDLNTLEKYDPKLFKAANNIFGKSYDYMRAYRAYKETMKKLKNIDPNVQQLDMFDKI